MHCTVHLAPQDLLMLVASCTAPHVMHDLTQALTCRQETWFCISAALVSPAHLCNGLSLRGQQAQARGTLSRKCACVDNPGAPADSRICSGFHLALHRKCKRHSSGVHVRKLMYGLGRNTTSGTVCRICRSVLEQECHMHQCHTGASGQQCLPRLLPSRALQMQPAGLQQLHCA